MLVTDLPSLKEAHVQRRAARRRHIVAAQLSSGRAALGFRRLAHTSSMDAMVELTRLRDSKRDARARGDEVGLQVRTATRHDRRTLIPSWGTTCGGVKTRFATRAIADLQAERKFRHPARDPVFKLSGRSTSEFFGVIRVRRQHSVPPANRNDHAL
jgi:hypothetical protein